VRLSLLYSLHTYNGDENIKTFVWELITPPEHGGGKVKGGHSGLSAPVPRGRKGKKARKESRLGPGVIPEGALGWVSEEKFDSETFLDKSYRRHLDRHNNKYLLRIRMLYYIQHEILGEHLDAINLNSPASELTFQPPACDGPPASWWDGEADRSLLVGTYRHGFEMYNMMRLDSSLCFLARCGPPDNAAVQVRGADPEN
jgi:chromodomain-helicase-DNA-binding protein 7